MKKIIFVIVLLLCVSCSADASMEAVQTAIVEIESVEPIEIPTLPTDASPASATPLPVEKVGEDIDPWKDIGTEENPKTQSFSPRFHLAKQNAFFPGLGTWLTCFMIQLAL